MSEKSKKVIKFFVIGSVISVLMTLWLYHGSSSSAWVAFFVLIFLMYFFVWVIIRWISLSSKLKARTKENVSQYEQQGFASCDFNKNLMINQTEKKWLYASASETPNIHGYSDINGYTALERTTTNETKKSGLGRAVVGGALFGVGGAIVGASTAGSRTTVSVNVYAVEVYLKDVTRPKETIYVSGQSEAQSVIGTVLAMQNQG